MTLLSLQALTWCTVTGVVASALVLASAESALAGGAQKSSRSGPAVTSTSITAAPAPAGQARPATPTAEVPLDKSVLRQVSAR